MNAFVMKKDNQSFVAFAQMFERFLTAIENKDLKNQLRDAIKLGDEEMKKVEDAKGFMAQVQEIRADITDMNSKATQKLNDAIARENQTVSASEEFRKYSSAESERLGKLRDELNDKAEQQSKKDAEHAMKDAQHAEKQRLLDNLSADLEEKRAAQENYAEKLRKKAATVHAAMQDV
jgi:chromosome segregation ATPase